jgi:Sec-independent protein secretion pathway component TatC
MCPMLLVCAIFLSLGKSYYTKYFFFVLKLVATFGINAETPLIQGWYADIRC